MSRSGGLILGFVSFDPGPEWCPSRAGALACWCARAIVGSTDSAQTTSPASCAATVYSQTLCPGRRLSPSDDAEPAPVCHGPNTSGESRDAIPVRYRWMVVSTIILASENGRPLRLVGRGNDSSTNDH